MAFSTQKNFFNVPFMNDPVEQDTLCNTACVKMQGYNDVIDDRSWARDDTLQSKFFEGLLLCDMVEIYDDESSVDETLVRDQMSRDRRDLKKDKNGKTDQKRLRNSHQPSTSGTRRDSKSQSNHPRKKSARRRDSQGTDPRGAEGSRHQDKTERTNDKNGHESGERGRGRVRRGILGRDNESRQGRSRKDPAIGDKNRDENEAFGSKSDTNDQTGRETGSSDDGSDRKSSVSGRQRADDKHGSDIDDSNENPVAEGKWLPEGKGDSGGRLKDIRRSDSREDVRPKHKGGSGSIDNDGNTRHPKQNEGRSKGKYAKEGQDEEYGRGRQDGKKTERKYDLKKEQSDLENGRPRDEWDTQKRPVKEKKRISLQLVNDEEKASWGQDDGRARQKDDNKRGFGKEKEDEGRGLNGHRRKDRDVDRTVDDNDARVDRGRGKKDNGRTVYGNDNIDDEKERETNVRGKGIYDDRKSEDDGRGRRPGEKGDRIGKYRKASDESIERSQGASEQPYHKRKEPVSRDDQGQKKVHKMGNDQATYSQKTYVRERKPAYSKDKSNEKNIYIGKESRRSKQGEDSGKKRFEGDEIDRDDESELLKQNVGEEEREKEDGTSRQKRNRQDNENDNRKGRFVRGLDDRGHRQEDTLDRSDSRKKKGDERDGRAVYEKDKIRKDYGGENEDDSLGRKTDNRGATSKAESKVEESDVEWRIPSDTSARDKYDEDDKDEKLKGGVVKDGRVKKADWNGLNRQSLDDKKVDSGAQRSKGQDDGVRRKGDEIRGGREREVVDTKGSRHKGKEGAHELKDRRGGPSKDTQDQGRQLDDRLLERGNGVRESYDTQAYDDGRGYVKGESDDEKRKPENKNDSTSRRKDGAAGRIEAEQSRKQEKELKSTGGLKPLTEEHFEDKSERTSRLDKMNEGTDISRDMYSQGMGNRRTREPVYTKSDDIVRPVDNDKKDYRRDDGMDRKKENEGARFRPEGKIEEIPERGRRQVNRKDQGKRDDQGSSVAVSRGSIGKGVKGVTTDAINDQNWQGSDDKTERKNLEQMREDASRSSKDTKLPKDKTAEKTGDISDKVAESNEIMRGSRKIPKSSFDAQRKDESSQRQISDKFADNNDGSEKLVTSVSDEKYAQDHDKYKIIRHDKDVVGSKRENLDISRDQHTTEDSSSRRPFDEERGLLYETEDYRMEDKPLERGRRIRSQRSKKDSELHHEDTTSKPAQTNYRRDNDRHDYKHDNDGEERGIPVETFYGCSSEYGKNCYCSGKAGSQMQSLDTSRDIIPTFEEREVDQPGKRIRDATKQIMTDRDRIIEKDGAIKINDLLNVPEINYKDTIQEKVGTLSKPPMYNSQSVQDSSESVGQCSSKDVDECHYSKNESRKEKSNAQQRPSFIAKLCGANGQNDRSHSSSKAQNEQRPSLFEQWFGRDNVTSISNVCKCGKKSKVSKAKMQSASMVANAGNIGDKSAILTGEDSVIRCATQYIDKLENLLYGRNLNTSQPDSNDLCNISFMDGNVGESFIREFCDRIESLRTRYNLDGHCEIELNELCSMSKDFLQAYQYMSAENAELRSLCERLGHEVGGKYNEIDAERLKKITMERNQLRQKCQEMVAKFAELQEKDCFACDTINQLSNDLNKQNSYIDNLECKCREMQMFYDHKFETISNEKEILECQIYTLKEELFASQCAMQKVDSLQRDNIFLSNEVQKLEAALNDYDCQYKCLMRVVEELGGSKIICPATLSRVSQNKSDGTDSIEDVAYFTKAVLTEIKNRLEDGGDSDANKTIQHIKDDCRKSIENIQEDCKKVCCQAMENVRHLMEENDKLRNINCKIINENNFLKAKLETNDCRIKALCDKLGRLDNELCANAKQTAEINASLTESATLIKEIGDYQIKNQMLEKATREQLQEKLAEKERRLQECEAQNDEYKKLTEEAGLKLNNKCRPPPVSGYIGVEVYKERRMISDEYGTPIGCQMDVTGVLEMEIIKRERLDSEEGVFHPDESIYKRDLENYVDKSELPASDSFGNKKNEITYDITRPDDATTSSPSEHKSSSKTAGKDQSGQGSARERKQNIEEASKSADGEKTRRRSVELSNLEKTSLNAQKESGKKSGKNEDLTGRKSQAEEEETNGKTSPRGKAKRRKVREAAETDGEKGKSKTTKTAKKKSEKTDTEEAGKSDGKNRRRKKSSARDSATEDADRLQKKQCQELGRKCLCKKCPYSKNNSDPHFCDLGYDKLLKPVPRCFGYGLVKNSPSCSPKNNDQIALENLLFTANAREMERKKGGQEFFDENRNDAYENFIQVYSLYLTEKLKYEENAQQVLRTILDALLEECGFCFCKNLIPKGKFYIICHKILHRGIQCLDFKELVYMHGKIVKTAESLQPGELLGLIKQTYSPISNTINLCSICKKSVSWKNSLESIVTKNDVQNPNSLKPGSSHPGISFKDIKPSNQVIVQNSKISNEQKEVQFQGLIEKPAIVPKMPYDKKDLQYLKESLQKFAEIIDEEPIS